MQEVIGAQDIGFAGHADRLRQRAGAPVHIFDGVTASDPERVEHSGDSGGGELTVVGDDSGQRIQ